MAQNDGPGAVDGAPEADQSSTMSFTGDFSAQLAALIAGGVSKEEMDSISALPSGSALLIVRRGNNVGARYLLDTDLQIAGRHPNAEIFLDDVTVSRRHAEFTRSGRNFQVRDLGSLNGSYYNGERINQVALSNGGEVQIGKYRLTFYASPLDVGSAATVEQ
ncbi:FHA domain-containing protein [Gulosibacter macacae]|uniref:FHA domain-containing protein n=1 Tax=Gulosibacter macacae TaxID=2488791 RepID=A0A3P3VZZ4_9MICO|nr:FHA domain-containing protein [Gulosibacter macacae]RRJ86253.1 FHA domain-containing protein [Gulosibacter macacae]